MSGTEELKNQLVHTEVDGQLAPYSTEEINAVRTIGSEYFKEQDDTANQLLNATKLSEITNEIKGPVSDVINASRNLTTEEQGFFGKMFTRSKNKAEDFVQSKQNVVALIDKSKREIDGHLTNLDQTIATVTDSAFKTRDQYMKLGETIEELQTTLADVKKQNFTEPEEQRNQKQYVERIEMRLAQLNGQRAILERKMSQSAVMVDAALNLKDDLEITAEQTIVGIKDEIIFQSQFDSIDQASQIVANINDAKDELFKASDQRFADVVQRVADNSHSTMMSYDDMVQQRQAINTVVTKYKDTYDANMKQIEADNIKFQADFDRRVENGEAADMLRIQE